MCFESNSIIARYYFAQMIYKGVCVCCEEEEEEGEAAALEEGSEEGGGWGVPEEEEEEATEDAEALVAVDVDVSIMLL